MLRELGQGFGVQKLAAAQLRPERRGGLLVVGLSGLAPLCREVPPALLPYSQHARLHLDGLAQRGHQRRIFGARVAVLQAMPQHVVHRQHGQLLRRQE